MFEQGPKAVSGRALAGWQTWLCQLPAHPLQELQNEQPASAKLGSQIGSAACSAELDSKMCLSKFYGDLGLCGEISVADVSGPQQLRSAICSLTRCLFSTDFLEGGLWF